ncbi:MAG: hypothetical protein KA063_03445 [Firmicutes bacterium]|nr:hypothetical protein [Bacillota bacterium]
MMNIKPRAAGGYIALLLAVIAVMAGYIVSSRRMPDVCLVDPWQLIGFELLLYVTLCYLWDRRSGAPEAFLKALGMTVGRLGLSALTALAITRSWLGFASYKAAFAQAAFASQPVVVIQIAYNVLLFALPFRVLRRPDFMGW